MREASWSPPGGLLEPSRELLEPSGTLPGANSGSKSHFRPGITENTPEIPLFRPSRNPVPGVTTPEKSIFWTESYRKKPHISRFTPPETPKNPRIDPRNPRNTVKDPKIPCLNVGDSGREFGLGPPHILYSRESGNGSFFRSATHPNTKETS